MSYRITEEELGQVIELDSEIDVAPFMETANMVVDEQLEILGLHSERRLKQIELYLAAHFYAVRDPRSSSESAGVSVSYQGTVALNLQVTIHGQQAMVLDTSGTLAAMNKGSAVIPMIEHLGSQVVGEED